jgi:glycerate kinase
MRVVIAPDKFKGCMSAQAVVQAIATGLHAADASIEIDPCPMADGGEGTVAALVAATGGRLHTRPVTGPLPQIKVDAIFGVLGDARTAVIEMASASGLALLKPEQRNPMNTTTYGTGQLLLEAARLGVRRIILGIGGSATTDAGLAALQPLGFSITPSQADGAPFTGKDLPNVVSVTSPPTHPLSNIEVLVACDVTNPLFGPNGAAPVFSPQKGATSDQVAFLDSALKQLAQRTNKLDLAQTPGAGAAGGLGFGMLAFLGAKLRPGIQIVIEATNLRHRLQNADLCITGEGQLDSQSLAGKTAIGVARLCKELHVPCIALVGAIAEGADAVLREGVSAYFAICDKPMTLDDALHDAPRLLTNSAANVLLTIACGAAGTVTRRNPEV